MQTRQTKTAFRAGKVTRTFEKLAPGPSVLEYCAQVLCINASSWRIQLSDDLSGRNEFINVHCQLRVYLWESRTPSKAAHEKIRVCNFVTKANSLLRGLILAMNAGICCHLTTEEASAIITWAFSLHREPKSF